MLQNAFRSPSNPPPGDMMRETPATLPAIDDLILHAQKPTRYVGGESPTLDKLGRFGFDRHLVVGLWGLRRSRLGGGYGRGHIRNGHLAGRPAFGR